MNNDVKYALSVAVRLLEDAKRHAERGEVGSAAWRTVDAAEWIRTAAKYEGNKEYMGTHHPTGLGNVLRNVHDDRPVDADFKFGQTISDIVADNG